MSWPCLCGKPAPCPDHGRYVGRAHVSGGGRPVTVDGTVLLQLMDDHDRYVQKQPERVIPRVIHEIGEAAHASYGEELITADDVWRLVGGLSPRAIKRRQEVA